MKENIQLGIFDNEPGTNFYQYRQGIEKIKEEMLKFGLSPNQTKVYLYLGKYGPRSAPEVSKALELPRTETYYIINTLQNQGLITAEFSFPTKYTAVSLQNAIMTLVNNEKEKIEILAKQEKELTEIWNSIPSYMMETCETKSERLQMLQGTQIICKLREMIKHAIYDLQIYGTEKDLSRFYHADLFDMLENSLLDIRLIVSPAQRQPEFLDGFDKKRLRVVPNGKYDDQCFIVKDHDEIVFFLKNANHPSHKVFAMWTDSKSMVGSLSSLFDYSWQESESVY